MAASGTTYTVFGFDSRFDGRPTVFLDSFPPTKVCSACGLVPSTVALLPCHHVLCQRCYAHCEDGYSSRCLLDKEVHQTEDVTWSTSSQDYVLRRKIRCWNSSNGCVAVGPASEILEHFSDGCEYQAATCGRCKKSCGRICATT
ncbi:TNF receptor-associated factor 3-like [Haemaphysalis longicornis]